MRVRRVGARALLLEVEPGDGEPLACVAAWRTAVSDLVDRGGLARPDDVVPGARTLLLDGIAASDARLLARLDGARGDLRPGPVVEVPTVYDGEDLAEVARLWGVTPDEAVARHAGTAFTVAFCGFAPGFPYLVGMSGEVPRRASPRPAVPAGSVALAGRYCGIYPTASPGGWQLLGRTAVPLFDPDRDPPALLPPGTRVRFVPVPSLPSLLPARPAPATADRALTVVRAGALTTVQDTGRPGLADLGVPRSGALDAAAARLANRLVGNPEDAAVLETTVDGVALRASAPMTVAVTGAGAPVRVAGRAADLGLSVGVGAGEVVDVRGGGHRAPVVRRGRRGRRRRPGARQSLHRHALRAGTAAAAGRRRPAGGPGRADPAGGPRAAGRRRRVADPRPPARSARGLVR